MKLNTKDKLPLGLKLSWICSLCEGEDFKQVDNETFKYTNCGRFFMMDILVHANNKQEEEFWKSLKKLLELLFKG